MGEIVFERVGGTPFACLRMVETSVADKEAATLGQVTVRDSADRPAVIDIWTRADVRRQGVATALMDEVARVWGLAEMPWTPETADGAAFRRAYEADKGWTP